MRIDARGRASIIMPAPKASRAPPPRAARARQAPCLRGLERLEHRQLQRLLPRLAVVGGGGEPDLRGAGPVAGKYGGRPARAVVIVARVARSHGGGHKHAAADSRCARHERARADGRGRWRRRRDPGAGGGASRQRQARGRARLQVGLGALGRLAAREEDAGELGDGQLRVVAGVLGVVACSNVHHRNLCAGGALSVRGASAGARAGQGRACGRTWYSTKVPPHLR